MTVLPAPVGATPSAAPYSSSAVWHFSTNAFCLGLRIIKENATSDSQGTNKITFSQDLPAQHSRCEHHPWCRLCFTANPLHWLVRFCIEPVQEAFDYLAFIHGGAAAATGCGWGDDTGAAASPGAAIVSLPLCAAVNDLKPFDFGFGDCHSLTSLRSL